MLQKNCDHCCHSFDNQVSQRAPPASLFSLKRSFPHLYQPTKGAGRRGWHCIQHNMRGVPRTGLKNPFYDDRLRILCKAKRLSGLPTPRPVWTKFDPRNPPLSGQPCWSTEFRSSAFAATSTGCMSVWNAEMHVGKSWEHLTSWSTTEMDGMLRDVCGPPCAELRRPAGGGGGYMWIPSGKPVSINIEVNMSILEPATYTIKSACGKQKLAFVQFHRNLLANPCGNICRSKHGH